MYFNLFFITIIDTVKNVKITELCFKITKEKKNFNNQYIIVKKYSVFKHEKKNYQSVYKMYLITYVHLTLSVTQQHTKTINDKQ